MLTAYKRNLWFNSDFHSGFVLNDNQKISEISFDVNPFQIDVNNNLKVITYVRDHHQSRPIQIKLKLPYNQSREVFNDDNEAFPIIYVNHTGVEGMSTYYPYSVVRLVPQQIQRFTFRIDDNYNSLNGRRIEGVIPEETLIQATNTNIPITIDSQYQINYQTPAVLPKGTYSATFGNGNIYLDNKKIPKPWGAYFAEDWSGTILRDSSGNGRHATTTGTIYSSNLNGNGAFAPISYISGGTTSTITWPSGSIPTTFTLLTLTRYNTTNAANQQRIIDASGANWFQGHIDVGGKQVGGAYYNVWISTNLSDTSVVTNVTDWVCTIGKNSGSTPNNLIANGFPRGLQTGGQGGYVLTINNGAATTQRSDWSMSCVIIWNTALTDSQMFELNRLVNNYKETGQSLKSQLWISNDTSYPILKDVNNVTINPLIWYRFDNNVTQMLVDSGTSTNNLTNNAATFDNANFIKGNGSLSVGNNRYVSFTNNIPFRDIQTANGLSISVWFKGTTSGSWSGIFSFGVPYSDGNTKIFTVAKSASTTNLQFFYPRAGNNFVTSGTNYFNNTWYHICWTITNIGVSTIYINGVNIGATLGQENFAVSDDYNTNKFLGRGIVLTEFLDGNIDDFRLYSSALTATQVTELYNGRLAIYNPPGFILGTEIEPEAE